MIFDFLKSLTSVKKRFFKIYFAIIDKKQENKLYFYHFFKNTYFLSIFKIAYNKFRGTRIPPISF